MEDSRLRKVYDTIVKEGYDVPDFATFETDMRDDKKLTRVRDRLVEDGYELPDFEQFKVDMFGTPASAPASPTFTAEQPRGMTKAEPEINGSAWDAYKNVGHVGDIAPEKETLTTFGEGVEQGAESLYQGGKYAFGETARIYGDSQRVYSDALKYLDEQGEGFDAKSFDVKDAIEADRYKRYEKAMDDWRSQKAKRKAEREEMGFFEGLKHKWDDPSMPDYKDYIGSRFEDIRAGKAIVAVDEALKEAGGDINKAKVILEDKSKVESWGDKATREAGEALSQMKPVEGAAWWGQMVPQVAGQATAIASNLVPYVGGFLGKALSYGTTAGLTASSAGQAMAEARQAGASDDEVWSAGVAQALIEYGSEKIPLDRLIGKTGSAAFKKGYKAVAGNIPEKELEKLLVEGNKKLGGKLLSGKTAKELIKDMGVEGASEFVAEFLGTYVPVIYADKESYPTLLEAVKNGWEGAKAGFAMGGFLGGGSMVLTNRANNKRREMQGGVTLAETKDYGVVEVLRTEDDMTEVLLPDGNTEWVPLNELTKTHTYSIEAWKTGDMNAKAQAAEEVYNEGYNTDEQEWTKVKTAYDFNRAMAEKYLGDVFEQLDKDPIATLQSMQESFPDEDLQIARDYVEAKARFEGVSDNVKDNVEQESQESDKVIQERINKTDGMVYSTTLHGGERVFITGGTVVLDDEGYIDVANSGDLWALYPDGTKEQLREGDLREKVEAFNTDELKATERAMIEELWRDKLNTFTYNDNEGEHVITVKQTNGEISRAVVDGVEQDVPTRFINELKDKIVQKSPAADNTAEVATETSAAGNTQTMIEPIPTETRGKVKRTAYHVVPIERTLEDLESNELTEDEKIQFAQANIDEINSELQKVLKQEPKMGADIQAYKADKAQWTVARDEWQKRLDYYNELLNRLKQPVQTSEVAPAVETPQATNKMQPVRKVVSKKKAAPEMPETVEEFVASVMPKITPESFKRETGLSNGEQRQLVGYIAGKGKGGITIEQAAESIVANYNDELLGLGFMGDEQDVRDMIINILSNGNPKGYIKRSRALREAELSQQEREMADVWAEGMGFDSYENYLDYTESLLEDIEEQRKEFDETEYYNNLAGNYEYDTTRERKDFGRGGELLQGEQFVTTTPSEVIGEGYEGTAVPGDVRGGGDNALTQGETRQVNTVNDESVAEGGNAPGQSDVVGNNNANALQNGNNELNLQKEDESDNEQNQNDIPVGGQVSQSVPQGEYGTQASLLGGMQETAARLRERIEADGGTPQGGLSRNVRDVENRVTREYAQENGLWIPFEDVFKLGRPSKSGNEHDTYLNAEQGVIYKVNNRMNTPSIPDLLDRMEQHNEFFPDSKYSLVGFTAVSENGDVWPVFAQEYVPNARMATNEEIDSYMGALGFNRVGDGRYSNGEVVIKDLKPRNVLVNPYGDAFVVDAEFEQEVSVKSEEKIQEPRSVEEVLENGDKLITNYNSRGEVEAVALEHDGRIVAVDSYDEGVLFEHTEYDENGVSTSVTRYDKQGNPVVSGKTEQPETNEVANAEPVNMDTFQLNMSDEDFNALLNGGNKTAIGEYLAEMDGLLRIGVGSPLDGQEALREEYRKAVEQYGKENIPAEIMDDLNSRMQPYSDLSRAVFDRKYALQDKLREIEASEAQANEQAEKEAKAEHKQTAFGGFLAGKTDLGASAAEKALSKKYNFDGKVMTVAEFVEDAVSNGNVKLSAIEEPKYKGASRAAWNRMDARQQEADAKRVKESGTKTVYTVNDHDLGKTAYDYAKFLLDKKAEQEKADAKKAVEDVIKPFAKEKREETDEGIMFRTTYHGSGAQFDRFDHSFMGTGEGAQAFGWGTYVTEIEGIGKQYATTMRDKAISDKHKENAIVNNLARQVLASNNGDRNAALDELRNLLNERWSDKKRVKAQIKIIETGRFLPESKVKANLYTVEIPDDNGSNYLHWEERINGEIQKRIADGLQSIGFEIEPGMNHLAYSRDEKIAVLNINAKGKDLYAELSDALGGDKAASLFLNDLGFVGISYPANATTGGRADGARNYVIFNEDDAQIEEHVMFRMSKTPQEFDLMQKAAVEKHGIVSPGLNNTAVNVVDVPRHDFVGSLKEARTKAKEWAVENYTGREFDLPDNAGKYVISKNAIGKYLDKSAFDKSENATVHLSVLKELPNVISNSIEVEIHADYLKGENGERNAENGVNRNDLLVHRIYGAVNIDGNTYRVKTTIHEFRDANTANTPHSYEVTKIELIEDSTVTPNDGIDNPLNRSVNSISATKLLEGVEKSYDKGKKVLDESENLTREGEGSIADREVVMDSDPYSKALGRPRYTGRKMGEYVARQRMEMAKRVKTLAQKLNLNIDVLESTEGLSGKRAKAKGWYEPKGKRIVVVIPNHSSVNDVVATVLHEAVAHHGLRELFGENFDTFLQNVYNNADADVREAIETLAAQRYNGNLLTATEEYLASLAENTDFEYAAKSGWWERIKDYFFKMLRGLGIEGFDGIALTDNELRYILWRSYQNLANPGMYNNVFAQAKDTALQYELKVGNYAPDALNGSMVAGEDITPEMKEGGVINPKSNRNIENKDVTLHKTKDGKVIRYEQLDLFNNDERSNTDIQWNTSEGNGNANDGAGNDNLQRDNLAGGNSIAQINVPLRPLKEGETSLVQRIFTKSKAFDFTAGEQIESLEDVAYIFKNLEDESIENSFAVLVKDGKPVILHLGMGGYTSTMINTTAVAVAMENIKPDKVYFVHNHPSGALKASAADVAVLQNLRTSYGDIVEKGIIINLKSGKFGVYDVAQATSEVRDEKTGDGLEVPVEIFTFNKQVFDKDFNPSELFQIHDADDIAAFISSNRLGDRNKIGLLVCNNQLKVVGNVFTPYIGINSAAAQKIAKDIVYYTTVMGGNRPILFGRFPALSGTAKSNLEFYINSYSGGQIKLVDLVDVESSESVLNEEGAFYGDITKGNAVERGNPREPEGGILFREGETATQKEKQNILKENAKAIRRLHNVRATFPITVLRNLRHALETEQERLEHDRLFAMRDELTQNKAVPVSIEVNPQGMTLQERITESLLKLANDNRENVETRLAAIRAYSGSLDNVLKLMRAQKGYDKKTVDMFVGLVKMYLRNNAVKGMSNYDIYRLLGLINRASGGYRMRVNRAAEQIVEIITKGHVRELQETMNRMLKTGAEKVNASGVVVQGGVDIVGKRKLNSFRDAIVMSQEAFEEKMAKIQEKVAKNPEDAEALAELDAMYLAQQYKEKVADSKADEEELLRQVAADSEMRGLLNRGVISRKTYNEFADGVRRNVIELRTRRIDEMQKILRALGGDISEGMLAAKEFRERELAKRMEIHDIAEADLKGVSKAAFKSQKASKAMDWFVYKNPIVRGVMAGLPTYNNLLSFFGEKTAGMTGNLKEYFLSKYTTAVQEKWKNLQKDKETLEEKTKRITGSSFEELGDLSAKIGATISFWDGEAVRERELSYGQMMYIYMVNKMTDGAMKLRSMGISEEMVNTIEGMLPKKLVKMADWIQGDFLPQMRGRFNVVHQRMFGASMDEVESYFPLVINKGSRRENVDVSSMIPTTPSTITGSIIKRRVNTAAIDINANALDVLMRHLEEMEQWAAFGEFIKDNNILLSDTDFKNRVKNMKSVRYGDGEDILEAFKECAQLATGTHRAKGNELSVNLARGLNSGKIAFGYYTALKQLLSQPAVLADAGVMDVVKAVTSPFEAWRWAAENVPGFEERWKGRTAGIETFEKTDKDWGLWDNKTMKKIRNLGMTPNAFVDAAVVAVNAKAVYDSRMKFYSSIGFDKAVANKRALHDAAVSYNETQQSGLGAFVSPMQADRTFLGMLLTLFRNSQIGYQRRLINAVKGIANRVNAYDELRANTVEKYKKMGLDDKKADEAAQRDMNVSLAKDAMSVVLFGYVLNLLWALGEDAIYLLFGDDEEEKERVMKENAVVAFSGAFEGLTLGGQAKEVMTRLYRGENVRDLGILTTPLETDWNKVFQKFQNEGWLSGAYQLVMTSTESLTGISPQRLVDDYAAVVDVCKGDLEMSRRVMLFVTRLMKVPQSQIDKVYQDWAMSEDDEELLKMAKRYVDYKMNRENPLDKDNPELRLKKLNRFDEAVMERITSGVESAQDIELVYDRVSPKYKDKLRRMWNSLTDEEAKDSATVNAELVDDFEKKMRGLVDFKVYDSLETMDDLRDDRFLKEVEAMGMPANTKKKNGGALSDEELRLWRLYKIASKTRNSVNELKRLMDKRPEDAEKAMMRVRMLRAKAMNLIEGYNE